VDVGVSGPERVPCRLSVAVNRRRQTLQVHADNVSEFHRFTSQSLTNLPVALLHAAVHTCRLSLSLQRVTSLLDCIADHQSEENKKHHHRMSDRQTAGRAGELAAWRADTHAR